MALTDTQQLTIIHLSKMKYQIGTLITDLRNDTLSEIKPILVKVRSIKPIVFDFSVIVIYIQEKAIPKIKKMLINIKNQLNILINKQLFKNVVVFIMGIPVVIFVATLFEILI